MHKYTNISEEPHCPYLQSKRRKWQVSLNSKFISDCVAHHRKQYSVQNNLFVCARQSLLIRYHTSSMKELKILMRQMRSGVFCVDENSAFLCYDMVQYQQVSTYQTTHYHNTKCHHLNFHHCEGLHVVKVTSNGSQPYTEFIN